MAKRRKLKKSVYIIFVIILFIAIGIYSGINIYQDLKYKETYEYKFTELGYSLEETKVLLDNFNDKEYDYLLSIEKDSTIIELINEKYYLKKNFKEYLTYKQENKDLNLSEVIRNINIHLDNKFYELDLKSDTTLDYKILVNKFYRLDETFIPEDLVSISNKYAWGETGSKKIRQIAYDAFLDMWNAANESGYYLMINSAYRSFADQKSVYDDFKENRGEKYADSIAARPGSSEHETGLAMDIFSKYNSNKNTFKDTEEAKWLKDNSYKYGFILRYPEDKVDITGYSYESWHFRYIGIEAATYCYQNDITYEEYYAYFIED